MESLPISRSQFIEPIHSLSCPPQETQKIKARRYSDVAM